MKFILSRKGFDSAAGGYASPILPDGTLLSLPIPEASTAITYAQLSAGENSCLDLMQQLKPDYLRLEKNRLTLDHAATCHLDPDICEGQIPRDSQWRGLFGQSDAAQTHLSNHQVAPGDVFLFFGWFRRTLEVDGRLRFDPKDKTGRHIIYGYLQVGQIIESIEHCVPWMHYHPHTAPKYVRKKTNAIYVAQERLSLDPALKGYGVFSLDHDDDQLVLSAPGMSRSKWRLPECFKNAAMTYHSANSWKEGYFQSAARGQEFVVSEDAQITAWGSELIRKHAVG